MLLEQALRTNKFRNPQHKLLLHLLHARSVIHLEQQRRLAPFNITPEQYNVLRILRGQNGNPIALQDLTSRMIDPASNGSRLVEKLRSKGLVSRKLCKSDRRRVDVTITPEGEHCLNQATAHILELENQFVSSIEADLATEINEGLNTFLSQLIEQPKSKFI